MLTSLAENGDVPEATILIAAFDLQHEDYGLILSHAGRLSDHVRFVNVDARMLGSAAKVKWDAHYPPAILGRLFLPTVIRERGARILTLDSDMIVNGSVRPLFDLSFDQGYIAAIHDTPRQDDLDYFNSGLMVIDVDLFQKYDIAGRSIRWLAEAAQTPRWPDQDALNEVVGYKWHRLDRTWNMAYCGGDGPLTSSFYNDANVAHFTGQSKPWADIDHVGRELYLRYLRLFKKRSEQYKLARAHVDHNFVATAFSFFFGREPANLDEIAKFEGVTSFETLKNIVQAEEFVSETFVPIMTGSRLSPDRYLNAPTMRQMRWAHQRLPLLEASKAFVLLSTSWMDLLQIIISDPAFGLRTGMNSLNLASRKLIEFFESNQQR